MPPTFVLVLYLTRILTNGHIIPEWKCASLYTQSNFGGNAFIMNDFDQTVNTLRDYHVSRSGWIHTGSVRVEYNCTVDVCTGPYFTGTCSSVGAERREESELLTDIRSAQCSCNRKCNCEDVILPSNEFGRVYFNGGCGTCNSVYSPLKQNGSWYTLQDNVKEIIIRAGCSAILYTGNNFKGTPTAITTPKITNYNGVFKSYRFSCGNRSIENISRQHVHSDLAMIHLPETVDAFAELIAQNYSLIGHAGLLAAITSMDVERSGRNGYIFLIGSNDTNDIGLMNCPTTKGKIWECRIPVDLGNLGISNAEIRIIYSTFQEYGTPYSDTDDDRFIASFDDYLSRHQDLKHVIPNAIIIRHEIDDDKLAKARGRFARKLKILNTLRSRLLDNSQPNVIFLLDSLDIAELRNPEEIIAQFQQVITEKLDYLNATMIIPSQDSYSTKVNGNWKMMNMEYWPLNLQRSLMLLCNKSGDALGEAVFKSAFQEQWTEPVVSSSSSLFLPKGDDKVEEFLESLSTSDIKRSTRKVSRLAEVANIRKYFKVSHSKELLPESEPSVTPEWLLSMCSNYIWKPISQISNITKTELLDMGLVDPFGRKMYPCRARWKGRATRVGSYTFEEGICKVFYKVTRKIKDSVEVLTIPGCLNGVNRDESGITYRLDYNLISSTEFRRKENEGSVVPVYAEYSSNLNVNKYISLAAFSLPNECGSMETIGTAMNVGGVLIAVFDGGRVVQVSNFKLLVCTVSQLPFA